MDLGEQSDLESHSNVISKENTAQKIKFPLRVSSVNVTKSTVSCGFGHIY